MKKSKELLRYAKALKILIVEDHDELRESTSEILRNFFNIVNSAKDGKEALKLYKSKRLNYYDIVLTDIQMPKMNGVELTKAIYVLNPSQKLIVISAHDDSEYLLPLINLGIEQFIQKPIDFVALIQVLVVTSKELIEKQKNKMKLYISHDYLYDKKNHSLYAEDVNVYLTKYEIIFMDLLTSNLEKIFSNEDIAKYYKSVHEHIDVLNIRKLVSKLRKKLPKDTLESVYSVGYRLNI